MPTNPRILIVSASAGAGHVRAGDALLAECHRRGLTDSAHWDLLKYTTPLFRHLYAKTYLDIVNRAPRMMGWIYDQTDTPWKGEKRRLFFEQLNAQPFLRALKKFQPDIILCTHFTPGVLISHLYDNGQFPVAPSIVLTDFDCHAMWLAPSYRHYFVAVDEAKAYVAALGIEPAAIHVTGIPIDPIFSQLRDRTEMRRLHNLALDRPVLLVTAGGFGVGPMVPLIQQLLQIKPAAQIVALAGKSKKLLDQLTRFRSTLPDPAALLPIGFTREIDQLMAAADLLISKPGGLTVAESLARGLPMCIVNPIPGQEQRNADLLLESGAAIKCNNLLTVSYKIERLLNDPGHLAALRKNTQTLAHPNAARDILDQALQPSSPHRAIKK
jgi:processive 1,2-diacylglycerol beta-glucosyltransferase